MGSTGSGHFTDYSGQKPKNGGDKTGGSNDQDRCNKAFNAMLEEIERCEYFLTEEDVPKVGDKVTIGFDGRPIVNSIDGKVIGYLPTKLNYIKMCLDKGFTYSGRVVSSSNDLVASVSVDIQPDSK
ncbi:hypothetical protein [Flagellimonas sp.]|uniref:hypothetical protein n=1 Tax=Flagellimonas sp. TaxID=2058762 RepID=UPI003BB19A24